METVYPTLKRPKRKLCYFTDKGSSTKQWAGLMTLDVDKMFDDLDSPSCDNDDLLQQTSDNETNDSEKDASPVSQKAHATEKPVTCQKDPEGDILQPTTKSSSPKHGMESPFKVYGPVKTSSPIEANMAVKGSQEPDNENYQIASPILFVCEADGKDDAKTDSPHTQEADCKGHITDEGDCELESPPSKIALSKPKTLSHNNKKNGSGEERNPTDESTSKKPQTALLEDERKTQRKENTNPPVTERSQPDHTAPQKKPEGMEGQPSLDIFTSGSKKMSAFRQRLRDDGQPKPVCFRKSPSRVTAPTPPEPEDDFLILEDDSPLLISIPTKYSTSKKEKGSRTSSTDKDSSTDKKTKDAPLEKAQKQQETKLAGTKTKKKKVMKQKAKNEDSEPENDANELCSPGGLPAGDLAEQVKTDKKKRQLKQTPSEEIDGMEQPEDRVSGKASDENPTLKMCKKVQSSSKKKSKSSKDGNEKATKRSVKSGKGGRKVTQESKAAKVTEQVEAVMEQSQEHQDAENLGSLSDNEGMNPDTHTEKDFTDKNNKWNILQQESPSGDSLIPSKRKRMQTGKWWLSLPENTEETKAAVDNQPIVKKSKKNEKEPITTAPSPAKTKKDRVLKKRNKKQPVSSPSRKTNKAKDKKSKRDKNGMKRQETSGKRRSNVMDTDQIKELEEQQQQQQQQQDEEEDEEEEEEEIQEKVQDQDDSSPLVLSHRELAHNSDDQVFQKVYHNNLNEKVSITSETHSPRRHGDKCRAVDSEKRRTRKPGDWWMVTSSPGDMESVSSQPHQQEPKPGKERKKKSQWTKSPKLGTPKNGNMAASLKTHDVTPKVKPLSAPKTVKRSLALFKNILTSGTETPTVVNSCGAAKNKKSKISTCPAEEAADPSSVSKTIQAITDVGGGESNSPPLHSTPQDSQHDSRLKLLSGPSSMIELEQFEEDDDVVLPSSRVQALSVSDLCGPPLKPLILQPKDEANLTEWFKSLWSTSGNNGPEVTPDQFDWFFYQGRAIGFQVDVNSGSICNGKILLGSHMKKPLWVDHSATTVFNLLTSSTKVTINSIESSFKPGQSFMVPCGSAYSIQNLNAQPAVLYFTRILAESLD